MADTSPSANAPVDTSASNKRDRTSSSTDAPASKETRVASSSPPAQTADANLEDESPEDENPEDEALEADDDDSALGGGLSSNGTSLLSSTLKGFVENGRRYSSLRGEGEVWCPSDEKMFEVFEVTHMIYLILDSQRRNVLFQSPIGSEAQNVLDIGTGDGSWPLDVADKFPNLTVHGIDLYPPPKDWVAPNCIFEVEDASKPWSWNKKFDLVHIRFLLGAFTVPEWKRLYRQVYDNLAPGGWIEQLEIDIPILCDDSTLPPDSHLASMGVTTESAGAAAGKPMDVYNHFETWIAEAGFTDIKSCRYKVPIGDWPKLDVYKHAGRVALEQFKSGLEGWMMWLLTRHGQPTPWSPEQVQVWIAFLRRELDQNWHVYQRSKRVWAQKPYDKPKEEKKVEVENVAEEA